MIPQSEPRFSIGKVGAALLLLSLALCFPSAAVQASPEVCPPGDPQRENLNALVHGIATGHADPWGEISRENFVKRAKQLCESVASDPVKGQIALLELSALIGDPHTGVEVELQQLPLRLAFFGDDLYVVAALDQEIVGRQITQVSGRDVSTAAEALGHLFAFHNEARLRVMLPLFLTMPEVLAASDWAEGATVSYGFANGDSVAVGGGSQIGSTDVAPMTSLFPSRYPGWSTAREAGDEAPVWLQNPESNYFVVKRGGLVWVRIHQVQNQKGKPSIKTFFKRQVMPYLKDAEKLVVDLRRNPGGNFTTLVPSLERLSGHRLDTPETLFVVTDGHSFSAAQYATWTLTKKTRATHIGTEPGDTLSSWLDASAIQLPHGNLKLYVSQRRPLFEEDRGKSIRPAHQVELAWEQYVDGVDPVWDWVKSR